GANRPPHRRVPAARLLLLRQLGAPVCAVAREDAGADTRSPGVTEARAAGIRAARERTRRARHCREPCAPRHLPEDARGLLPDVAPPLRVPAPRLWRIHDLLCLLQEGLPGDQ